MLTPEIPRRFGRSFAIAAVFLTLLCISPLSASAQTLSLSAPALANKDGALAARFGVMVKDLGHLRQELENGSDIELRCDVALYRVSDYWLDSTLAETELSSILSYDSLKREYVLTLPGNREKLRDTDMNALLDRGWSTLEVGLGSWDRLIRGSTYSLRLAVDLVEADAPRGLTRYLYFWSWDTGAGTTFELTFKY